jgi:hypothetical protein
MKFNGTKGAFIRFNLPSIFTHQRQAWKLPDSVHACRTRRMTWLGCSGEDLYRQKNMPFLSVAPYDSLPSQCVMTGCTLELAKYKAYFHEQYLSSSCVIRSTFYDSFL